jgi:Protein of unknown function (DUF3052)
MSARAVAGYSGTPLAGKLGIKAGSRLCVRNAPPNYEELVAPLPDGVKRTTRTDASTDILHLFVTLRVDLSAALSSANGKLADDAAIWVSWPKKASKVPTDITEDTIRAVALPLGLVDIKVCAVDEVWSGLKLVRRKELRKATRKRG